MTLNKIWNIHVLECSVSLYSPTVYDLLMESSFFAKIILYQDYIHKCINALLQFASGSPVFWNDVLVAIVSGFHVFDDGFLNIHCTDTFGFRSEIASANSPNIGTWDGWEHIC